MSVHFDPNSSPSIPNPLPLESGRNAPPPSPAEYEVTSSEDANLSMVLADRMRQQETADKERKLFSEKENCELYWAALLYRAYGKLHEAELMADAIRSHNSYSPSPDNERWETIQALFDQIFIKRMENSPQTLSSLGLLESIGIFDHTSKLDDVSPDAVRSEISEAKKLYTELKKFPKTSVPEELMTTYETLCWQLDHQIKGESFITHEYQINQLFGVLFELNQTFLEHHQLKTQENIQTYILRLREIPRQIKQAIIYLKEQGENGIFPPRECILKVIAQINSLLPEDVENHLYYAHLEKHTDSPMVLGEAKAVLKNEVYPALGKLLAKYESLLEEVKENHGVATLPYGNAYYCHMLKKHTTTDMTPDEIHELGLVEVAKIHEQMRKHLREVGIEDDAKSPGVLMQELQKREDLYFPDSAEGREACMKAIHTILDRCRKELWPLFGITPKAKVEVKPVPEHEEEGMPGAYYCDPSLDGSRPGYYYINLRSMKELPKFGLETLSVHEAEPGHHFQDTIRNELPLPVVMKTFNCTASQEGWALYVEKLAFEQGFFTSDYDILGHYQDEILRAVRLVIDTGLHAKGWSREKAIDYMMEVTGYTRETVITEVDRYLVMPGQACAYKIGQLKILELRQKAKEALQDKFNLKEFHNIILQAGIVPIPVLEDAVGRYIKSNHAAAL